MDDKLFDDVLEKIATVREVTRNVALALIADATGYSLGYLLNVQGGHETFSNSAQFAVCAQFPEALPILLPGTALP